MNLKNAALLTILMSSSLSAQDLISSRWSYQLGFQANFSPEVPEPYIPNLPDMQSFQKSIH